MRTRFVLCAIGLAAAACERDPSGLELPSDRHFTVQASIYEVWTPRVVRHDRTAPVTLTVLVPGPSTDALLELRGGTVVSLSASGRGTYSAELGASQVLAGYRAGDQHNFVGYLEIYDGATRLLRGNVFVNVREPGMPDVAITSLGSDAQASAHVLNVRYDSLYLGGVVPPDVLRAAYRQMPDDFDFLAIVEQVNSFHNRFYLGVRNTTSGLGLSLFDRGAEYGSASRLQGLVHYPIADYFDLGEKAAVHEIGHRWVNFLATPALQPGRPHWPISDLAYGIMGWSMAGGQGGEFPFQLEPLDGGNYAVRCVDAATSYNDLELYLMGLLPGDSVRSHFVFRDQAQSQNLRCGGTLQGPVDTVTIDQVIADNGLRPPAAVRDFRMGTIVLSAFRLLTADEMAFFDAMAARGESRAELPFSSGFASGVTRPFYLATGGRATLSTTMR